MTNILLNGSTPFIDLLDKTFENKVMKRHEEIPIYFSEKGFGVEIGRDGKAVFFFLNVN